MKNTLEASLSRTIFLFPKDSIGSPPSHCPVLLFSHFLVSVCRPWAVRPLRTGRRTQSLPEGMPLGDQG